MGSVVFSSCVELVCIWVLFLLLVSQGRIEALSPESEGHILLEFRDNGSLGLMDSGAEWNRDESDDPCGWVGVGCSANLTIESLDFTGWSLQGVVGNDLYKYLRSLTSLKELDLSSNRLSIRSLATFPETLTRLDLSDNGRSCDSNTIPASISNLHNLRYLFLDNNCFLEGMIPWLDGLVDLQVLSASTSGLGGPIPVLGNLTKLVRLDFSNNQLIGTIPTLKGLIKLVRLDFSNNQLNGAIPSLEGLTSLMSLDLSHNNLTGGLPHVDSLRRVNISHNQLVGALPAGIGGYMPNLTWLDLSNNQLSGHIPNGLGLVQSLRLSHNQLSGQIPPDIQGGDFLDLSGNQLSGRIPVHLLDTFVHVNLSRNSLIGDIPLVKDPGPLVKERGWLGWTVDLSHNKLDGSISLWPAISAEVNSLWLQNNQLSGDIISVLSASICVDVRVQGNRFTGDITRLLDWDQQFTDSLEVLDLSYNVGVNVTPTSRYPNPLQTMLEKLQNLRELRLAGINFTGISLPQRLDTSKGLALRVLDLSHCNLEGEIPVGLFPTLSKLTYFDVSNNRLSGPIPSTLPAALWNPSFFANNSGLCGGPIAPCNPGHDEGMKLWLLCTVIAAAVSVSMGSCLVVGWRWRVYSKLHQQDADLIATLLERDTVSVMPLRDLRKATANFSEVFQIGVGGFGTVYTGRLSDGTTVAIKRSKREGSPQDKQQFLNEVRILSQVNHRHLVKLLGCSMENKIALLVYEYIPNGTLQEHLQGERESRLTWSQRLHIAIQTSDALAYLHSAADPPIFHRDVKSANILLDHDLNAKVADFGISKLAPMGATHVSTVAIQGTIGYIDPEYYTSFQLTPKSDVYSFGVVLLELITAKRPVDFLRSYEEVSLVNLAVSVMDSGEWLDFIDPLLLDTFDSATGKASIQSVANLAVNCLASRSRERPEMREVCQHLRSLLHESDTYFNPVESDLPPDTSKAEMGTTHACFSVSSSDIDQSDFYYTTHILVTKKELSAVLPVTI